MGFVCASAELTFIPTSVLDPDAEYKEQLHKLIEALEENEDVQQIYHNANLN